LRDAVRRRLGHSVASSAWKTRERARITEPCSARQNICFAFRAQLALVTGRETSAVYKLRALLQDARSRGRGSEARHERTWISSRGIAAGLVFFLLLFLSEIKLLVASRRTPLYIRGEAS